MKVRDVIEDLLCMDQDSEIDVKVTPSSCIVNHIYVDDEGDSVVELLYDPL